MRHFTPEILTLIDSSVPENTDNSGNTYPVYDVTSAQNIDNIVVKDGHMYKSLDNLKPLAEYSWSDYDSSVSGIVIKLADDTKPTITTVPCTQNVTVIYVISSYKNTSGGADGKYFMYTGTTGDVDFTAIDFSTVPPTNWSDVTGSYRSIKYEPADKVSNVKWSYMGATTRFRPIDESYNSQAVINNTSSEWWEFEVKNIDKVVLFNLQSESARLVIYIDGQYNPDTQTGTPIYDNTISSLLDTSSIVNWRTLVQYETLNTKNADWSIPFYSGTVRMRVYLTALSPTTLRLGEILAGKSETTGVVLDGVPVQIKSTANVIQKSNGDIILEDEGDKTKIYLLFNFNVKFDTVQWDYTLDKCIDLINRRIVVYAENQDDEQYRSLIIYGFVRDASPTLTSSKSKSDIKMQVQRFN